MSQPSTDDRRSRTNWTNTGLISPSLGRDLAGPLLFGLPGSFDRRMTIRKRIKTRVLVRGTLHRCAKAGACSRRFSRPSCCARGNTCKRRTGPPQNMWCFSVLFCVGTCKSEIAQTGRQRISQDGIGRSHQDLAIRNLGSRANPAFAPNTAVDGGAPRCHAQVWPMLGRGVIRESEDVKTALCTCLLYTS